MKLKGNSVKNTPRVLPVKQSNFTIEAEKMTRKILLILLYKKYT